MGEDIYVSYKIIVIFNFYSQRLVLAPRVIIDADR